jgi:hypothetical protein
MSLVLGLNLILRLRSMLEIMRQRLMLFLEIQIVKALRFPPLERCKGPRDELLLFLILVGNKGGHEAGRPEN